MESDVPIYLRVSRLDSSRKQSSGGRERTRIRISWMSKVPIGALFPFILETDRGLEKELVRMDRMVRASIRCTCIMYVYIAIKAEVYVREWM